MAYQRESWKRFIEIVLTKIPTFIEKYPPKSQTILNDFFRVIKYHEKAAFDRKELSNQFNSFNEKYYRSDEYIETAFLWFAIEYLKNAIRLLSIADFHADNFYQYLTTFLKGNSNITGIFHLISKETPLFDLKWEKLQYACSKLQFSLSSEQLHYLKSLYTLVSETEPKFFDPRRLKYSVESLVKSSGTSRNLSNLLTQLEAQWNYWLSPTAFGLSNVYVQFQLEESVSLKEIIDHRNLNNTTLTNSRIFQIRNSPGLYAGFLVIPTIFTDQLIRYFNICEKGKKLVIKELDTIKNIRFSASLNLYQNNRGWGELSKTDLGRLAQKLKTEQPRKDRTKLLPFYLTQEFNRNWSYLENPDPSNLIALYCKSYPIFSLNDLNSELNNKSALQEFDKTDCEILKTLHQEKVVQLNLIYTRLILEYSIDQYLVEIPFMPIEQLSRLLTFLPWTELFYTSRNILMITYLTAFSSEWMKKNLVWTVKNIIESNIPIPPKISWYDTENQQWNTPQLIRDLKKNRI